MRVLCVSPRFAPADGADAHRLRLLLAHFAAQGCDVEVLAVDPASARLPVDSELLRSVPRGVPVHRVRAWPLSGWGLNGLAQRTIVPLYLEGVRVLRSRKFDLVFFSTTEFALHVLGPLWQWRTGVPFCMDYQDPWVSDYYDRTGAPRPGGRLKFALAHALHRVAESWVAPRSSGFLAVSPQYIESLRTRYGQTLARVPGLVAPFPADASGQRDERDRNSTGVRTWRYIGRGGPDMAKTASAFFLAWRQALDEQLVSAGEIEMEISGTSYAASGHGTKSLEPLAAVYAMRPWVSESTDRLPYGRATQLLGQSSALVVFGSDDATYTASKIFPYLMARRPLLAVFDESSPAATLLRSVRGCTLVTFAAHDSIEALAARIRNAWFAKRAFDVVVPLDDAQLSPYLASSQAAEVKRLFDEAIAHAR